MAALIVYFSRAGGNYISGTIRDLTVGNTEVAAKLLHERTGAERFQLLPVQPYSADYSECIAQAQDDQRRDARPELKHYPDSLDGIDTVYLGYPNYWGTLPMCVFTFLEHFDFSGKTIAPFCTNEGSGMGTSEADIRRLCPGAVVTEGLSIHGAKVKDAGPAIDAWLQKICD